jgi:hypothetical protein
MSPALVISAEPSVIDAGRPRGGASTARGAAVSDARSIASE